MNSSNPPSSAPVPAAAEARSALFANLVLQQTNMALMFLGKTPGPEGMTPPRDLEAASLFIDTLEMLAEKTRGNLDAHEAESDHAATVLRRSCGGSGRCHGPTGRSPGRCANRSCFAGRAAAGGAGVRETVHQKVLTATRPNHPARPRCIASPSGRTQRMGRGAPRP